MPTDADKIPHGIPLATYPSITGYAARNERFKTAGVIFHLLNAFNLYLG